MTIITPTKDYPFNIIIILNCWA